MEKQITVDWATAKVLIEVLVEARQDAQTAEHYCEEYTALIGRVGTADIVDRFENSLREAFGIEQD